MLVTHPILYVKPTQYLVEKCTFFCMPGRYVRILLIFPNNSKPLYPLFFSAIFFFFLLSFIYTFACNSKWVVIIFQIFQLQECKALCVSGGMCMRVFVSDNPEVNIVSIACNTHKKSMEFLLLYWYSNYSHSIKIAWLKYYMCYEYVQKYGIAKPKKKKKTKRKQKIYMEKRIDLFFIMLLCTIHSSSSAHSSLLFLFFFLLFNIGKRSNRDYFGIE